MAQPPPPRPSAASACAPMPLRALTGESLPALRMAAVQLLAAEASDRAVGRVLAAHATTDPSPWVRRHARVACAAAGALPPLRTGLGDLDPGMRRLAARLLASQAAAVANPATLQTLLRQPQDRVPKPPPASSCRPAGGTRSCGCCGGRTSPARTPLPGCRSL